MNGIYSNKSFFKLSSTSARSARIQEYFERATQTTRGPRTARSDPARPGDNPMTTIDMIAARPISMPDVDSSSALKSRRGRYTFKLKPSIASSIFAIFGIVLVQYHALRFIASSGGG